MGGISSCGFVSTPRKVSLPPCFSDHTKGKACVHCSWDGTTPCDRCDGKHTTDNCPYFRKDRDQHRDAWQHYSGTNGGKTKSAPSVSIEESYLRNPRVICQPGDGSCLFRSLAYGLGGGTNASSLRREIAAFILRNPSL